MSAKTYYIAHYDFWFTPNRAKAVLTELCHIFQDTFKDKTPNEELFLFALDKENLIVGTCLIVFTTPPADKILNTILTTTHNVLVDKATVYGEGEILVIESPSVLLPFQFMMGELILSDYVH